MGSVVSYLEQAVPGAYVTSLMVGDNVVQDTENGFFLNINKQIDLVCQMVNNDEKLKGNPTYTLTFFFIIPLFQRWLPRRWLLPGRSVHARSGPEMSLPPDTQPGVHRGAPAGGVWAAQVPGRGSHPL